MRARILVLVIGAVIASFLYGPIGIGYADTIVRTDGRRIKGEIIESTPDYVKVKTKYGEVIVDRDDILRIDKDEDEKPDASKDTPTSKANLKEYKRRLAIADEEETADAYYNLGKWCRGKKMEKEARKAFEKAIEIRPSYAPARNALGHAHIGGKWMSSEQAEKAGYAKNSKGKWVSKDKLDAKAKKKLEAERRKAEKYASAKKKEYEGVPWTSRHIIKTEYYEIHCNSTRKIAERYARIMDSLHRKFLQVFAALKPEKRRSNVYIHRNQKEFMEMRRKPAGVGGYYMPSSREVCTYHGTFGVTGTTLTILAHEGCHQFQHLFVKGNAMQFSMMPIWLLEGMAVIFEASEIRRSGSVKLVGPHPDRMKQLQQMIRDEKHITLQKCLSTPRRQFGGSHYNTAGAFTWWLLKASKKKQYRILYEKYLIKCRDRARSSGGRGMGRGGSNEAAAFDSLAQSLVGKDLEKLEEEWRKYVLKVRLPKLGRMSRNTFKSKELGFEVTRPDKSWSALKESKLRSAQIMCWWRKKTEARFSVYSVGNGLGTTAEESINNYDENRKRNEEAAKRAGKKTVEDYKLFEKKKVMVAGYPAAEFIYQQKDTESKWNTELCKIRRINVYAAERLYVIFATSTLDKWKENEADFNSMFKTFIVTLK
ncbi:MAG: DUF1570 domain-containing protein [Planctomycetota bacterium]|nr:MAG: DUF1570 domain-containing protein [Planctomycetota bacterium]